MQSSWAGLFRNEAIQECLWVNNMFSAISAILWTAFIAFVMLALAVDLGVFHRQARTISLREATAWSIIWVAFSLAFNFVLLHLWGHTAALEFFAGYVIEKSLSVDNLFVFVMLFRYFAVESRYQHRVLYWGVLGDLIMRGVLIGMGVALTSRFEWVLYVFGAFLVYAGARMMFEKTEEVHPERNLVFRWARKLLPMNRVFEKRAYTYSRHAERFIHAKEQSSHV